MRVLKTWQSIGSLMLMAAASSPLPAASPNAASHVRAELVVDEETSVTSLVITGDHKNNSVTVTIVDGTIYVIGEGKTKVNNRKFPATFDGTDVTELVISMGKGDDTVVIDMDLTATATLDADGGAGDDSLTVTGVIDPAAVIIVENWESLDPPDLGT